jgi:TPR repeat protein
MPLAAVLKCLSFALSCPPPATPPQRRLGYRRLVGRGVARDEAAAYRAFTVAADGGDAMALYNLGYAPGGRGHRGGGPAALA